MGESSHAAAEHKRAVAERKPSAGLAARQPDLESGLAVSEQSMVATAAGENPAADGDGWTGKLVGRHAALLADTRFTGAASQARRVRLLQGLQRGYGNGHVARVLARVQDAAPVVGEPQGALQRAVDCPAPPVEKPTLEPTQDPRFKQVAGKVKQVAATEKKHAPAKAKVAEAQAAAQPPSNETASQAAEAQVATMAAQKPGTFDKQAFVAAVRKAIDAASPKNLEEADNFKGSGKAEQVKEQVGGLVSKGKDSAQQAIKQTTEAAPDASKAKPKPVTPMPPEQPGKAPGNIGAAGAMPAPKSGAEVSLAHGPCELNSQMAEAEVTEEQLKKSNEPEFEGAVDAKKQTEEHAKTAPQEYRAQEQATLDKEKAEATAGANVTLGGMHAAKVGATNKVGNDKSAAKAKDEAARAQVAKQIEAIYTRAKTDVTKILADLDPLVDKTFKEGEEAARTEFTTYVKTKTDAYKEDRYSGVLGWGRWLKDKFKTNPELNKIIDDGRSRYLVKMDAVINSVAEIIGRELTRAKERIAQGRKEVQEYVDKLPKELKQAGADGLSKIESQFDQLESDVNDKQDGLVQSLAEKYTAARDAMDAEAEKMKEANKGLVDKAMDAVVGVIKTILKLKDMLLGVLAKAADVIGKIIKDPIGFLGNLVDAIGTGLKQFVKNIGKHLEAALMSWLFGALGGAGIQLPDKLDLKGILSLVMQVLGLTWDNIRAIAVRLVGEKIVAAAEGTLKVLVTLVKEGPAGLWEWIKDKIAEINIEEMVIGAIKDFVITKVITAGVTWLLGMLNPASAFIKACKMIYDLIMFFIERGSQIMEFVNSVLDGIGAIAAGSIGAAADLVEKSLAKILPLAISFLAAGAGVGGIAEEIKKIIEKIRAPITKLVTAVLGPLLKPIKKLYDKGAKFVKGLVDKGKALGKKAIGKVKDLAKKGIDKVKGKFAQGKAWTKGKLDKNKKKRQEKKEKKSESEKVKADAIGDLTNRARGLSSIEAFANLRTQVLNNYRSKGLKTLSASLGGGTKPQIKIVARASADSATITWKQVFAAVHAEGGEVLKELDEMKRKFEGTDENAPAADRDAVWAVLSVAGKPVGPMQRNESKKVHAEDVILRENWDQAISVAKDLAKPGGDPVPVVLSVSASPCARCSARLTAKLIATRAALESVPGGDRIRFTIASKGAYERRVQLSSEEAAEEREYEKRKLIEQLLTSKKAMAKFIKNVEEYGVPVDSALNALAEMKRIREKVVAAKVGPKGEPLPASTTTAGMGRLMAAGWDLQVLQVKDTISSAGKQLEDAIKRIRKNFAQSNAK